MSSNRVKSFVILHIWLGIIIVLMWLLSGCSIEKRINYHNKRAGHHKNKAISLGYKPQADTVYVLDTLISTETHHDTTFISKGYDTILIEKDRLKIKYIRFADSVFIEGTCEADTVVKRIPYAVHETVYVDKSFFDYAGVDTWWKKLLFWLGLLLIGVLFLWKLIK